MTFFATNGCDICDGHGSNMDMVLCAPVETPWKFALSEALAIAIAIIFITRGITECFD